MSAVAKVTSLQFYQRDRQMSAVAPPIPEPVQLYCLVSLAFVLHIPYRNADICIQCHTPWPCDHVRLAFRLREGF